MKIHEYNEMMAYLTRPAPRQPVVQGGVIGEGGMFQGEDMGHRTGFSGIQKVKNVKKFTSLPGVKLGDYYFEMRDPQYKGDERKIKIGPFETFDEAQKVFNERKIKMGEIKAAGPQAKITEQTKTINNFVTDFYEKNLNKYNLRDYKEFEKELIEEFKKLGIKDLGSGKNKRKSLTFDFPNVGKKEASRFALTLYGMEARTPSGKNLQTDAQGFFKKAFYSGKLKKNPELVEKLRRYLEYYNKDKRFYGLETDVDRVALKADYADVLDPKVKSDLIYLLESDEIGTGKVRSIIIKEYLPNEYKKYVDKKNQSSRLYKKHMKEIESSLTEKQLKQALNGETSITKFMKNQTNLLNEIFDTSELKKAGYSELIFNADHLEGMSEIARMDNPDDQIRALRNLVGTTSEINRELGLEGFSSKRKFLMEKIKNGINVETNVDELNRITKKAYPQFEGDLYKYNPATKTAVPTKNFIFNYDPETAFRQYFNELVKHPVGSKILKKQYLDKPELQKVIEKDPKLKQLLNEIGIKPNDTQKTILNKIQKSNLPGRAKALILPIVAGTAAITGADLMTSNLQAAEPGQMPQGSPGQLSEDEEGLSLQDKAALGTVAVAGAKPAWKYLGKPALKVLGSPGAGLGFAGWSFVDNFNASKAETEEGKVYDALTKGYQFGEKEIEMPGSAVGTELLFPEAIKRGAKKLGVEFSKQGGKNALAALGRFAMNPIGRAASIMTPAGLTLNAAAVAKQYYDFAKDEISKVEQMKPEDRKAYNEMLMDETLSGDDYYTSQDVLDKYNQGGRVGFDEGSKPKSPGRRTFLKGITALAALPVVGKFFKMGKVLEAGKYTGPTIEKIKGMPEWFPSLVKKLYTEGTDVTKEMAYKERQVVKRGTLESGDDVDMIYDLDTGNVSIEVRSKGGETSSGSYNEPYGLDFKKGEVIDDVDVPQTGTIDPKTGYTKKLPDEFSVNESRLHRSGPEPDDVEYYGDETNVEDAISDLTELEAFAKNKTVKQIHKKKGTKPKDLNPSEWEVDWDDVYDPYD
jgi:hypothetical protein